MINPLPNEVDRVLSNLEHADKHPTRQLAAALIAKHRTDFSKAPRELKMIFYLGAVRYRRERWWSRWLRRS